MPIVSAIVNVTDVFDGAAGAPGTPGAPGAPGSPGTPGDPGTSGDSFKTIYLFQNGTSTPTVPADTAGFNASTGVAVATGSWTVTASVPSAGQTIYVASAIITQVGGVGNWSVDTSWAAGAAGASGTNGTDGTDGTNGSPGSPGTPGANGSDAPRFAELTLYTNPAVTSTPSAPSATITWSSGAISGITSGWSRSPPTQTATSNASVYSSQLVFIDVSPPFTSTTTTGSTPVQGTNFSGLVTFTGGDFAVDGSTITSIDGGNITTNTITATQIASNTITATQIAANAVTASKINVSNLAAISATLGSVNIDAANITSGTIASARIGNLNANNITAGTLSADRLIGAGISAANSTAVNIAAELNNFNVNVTLSGLRAGTRVIGIAGVSGRSTATNGRRSFTTTATLSGAGLSDSVTNVGGVTDINNAAIGGWIGAIVEGTTTSAGTATLNTTIVRFGSGSGNTAFTGSLIILGVQG